MHRVVVTEEMKKAFAEKDEECPICYHMYDTGQEIRKLGCTHMFHTACIDPWLTSHRPSCPMCMKAVFEHEADVDVAAVADAQAAPEAGAAEGQGGG